jgi:hypothetical protein
MSAFLNALREEGTKEDCLVQIERLLAEKSAMAARIEELEKALEPFIQLPLTQARADNEVVGVYVAVGQIRTAARALRGEG